MKILLIEDDEYTSELLSTMLATHRYAVDTIADGALGLEMATRWSYDLILLDILLPTLNGIEVCRRLRAQDCKTPILVITRKDSSEDIIAGLDAGADDYVAKSCDVPQLLARVRAVLRRGSAASSPVLTWGALCLDPALAQVTYQQKTVALRPKEYSLLELFLRQRQRILSRSAIIDHLWSMEESPVEGAVTNLIKDLRQRLKSAGMVSDLIETVYGLGYRLKVAPAVPEQHEAQNQASLTKKWDQAWNETEQSGMLAIQKVTERFRASLEQRIARLNVAEQSLQNGDFSLEQRKAICVEAHKLAGGLGTFGHPKASEVARAIERLLDQSVSEPRLVNQFTQLTQLTQLIEELKQELACDDSRI